MEKEPDVRYTPSKTGAEFMLDNSPVRLIQGPVGSGKSSVCCMDIFKRCAEMPKCKDGFRRSRWVITRNTVAQLKGTTFKTWTTFFPDGKAGRWREGEKTFYLEVGDIRAEIVFLPLDTPDDQARLLSLELTGAWGNEARELSPDIIVAIRSRLARYPSKMMLPANTPYWHGLILDTNPPNEDSWLHQKFEEEKPEGWKIFKQPSGLSPEAENRENLSPTYYEDMMSGASEDWIRVHVEGKYGRSMLGKGVFEKTFNHDFHVAANPLLPFNSHSHPIVIGMDFGRTAAATIGQRNAHGQALIYDELVSENMGLEQFINTLLKPLLASRFPGLPYLVAGDPAGWAKSQINEESCADVLKKAGFRAIRPSTNAIDSRLRAVESLLLRQIGGKPALLIDPKCTNLIRAFNGGYRYRQKTNKRGEYETTPDKNMSSHISDSCQYYAMIIEGAVSGLHQHQARETERVDSGGWS